LIGQDQQESHQSSSKVRPSSKLDRPGSTREPSAKLKGEALL